MSGLDQRDKNPLPVGVARVLLVVLVALAGILSLYPVRTGATKQARRASDFPISIVVNSTSTPDQVSWSVPDEHTSYIADTIDSPPKWWVFMAGVISGGGAQLLRTPDFYDFSQPLYASNPIFQSGFDALTAPKEKCSTNVLHPDPYLNVFDGHYAAPGSVLIDPYGNNPFMIYESENHCRDANTVVDHFYASVGFTRATPDVTQGYVWPTPNPAESSRFDVIDGPYPKPTSTEPLGDAIPAGYVDDPGEGETKYLYVYFEEHASPGPDDSDTYVAVARATISPTGAVPTFKKWDGTGWNVYGTLAASSGAVNRATPLFFSDGSTSNLGTCHGSRSMKSPSIVKYSTYYIFLTSCVVKDPDAPNDGMRGDYYSVADDLNTQDWTPLEEAGGFGPVALCTSGPMPYPMDNFNGWYPTLVDPAASPGVITGADSEVVVEADGCLTRARHIGVRGFQVIVAPSKVNQQMARPQPRRTPIPSSTGRAEAH